MNKDKIWLRSAQIAGIGSFALLVWPKIKDLVSKYMNAIHDVDYYQLGLWLIFIVSSIVYLYELAVRKKQKEKEKEKQLNDFISWNTYQGPHYQIREFNSLEDKINYLISIKLDPMLKELRQINEQYKESTGIKAQLDEIKKSLMDRLK